MVLTDEDIVLDNLGVEGQKCGKFVHASEITQLQIQNNVLNVMHLNIRSVRKNFDEFLATIATYNLDRCDIIFLGESFQLLSINQFNIPGFTTFYNEGSYNKNDGVIFFVKNNLNCQIDNIKLNTCGVTISILKSSKKSIPFRIIALYRPNPSNLNAFIDEIDTYLDENRENNHFELFLGDLNINILSNDANTNNYLSVLARHGFEPYIQSHTRVTAETATCIDHIFLKKKHNVNYYKYKSYILNCNITDHYPVMMAISTEHPKNCNESDNNTHKNYLIDFNKMKSLIANKNWSDVLNTNDVQLATNLFTNDFSDFIDQCKTTKTSIDRKHNKIKPWVTVGLITAIKNRDKMKIHLNKQKINNNYTHNLENQYKAYRNRLNNLLKKSKHDYYKNLITLNQNNVKKVYDIISEATNEKGRKSHISEIVNENGQYFQDDKLKSNYCNEYYANVGINMAKKITEPKDFTHNISTINNAMFLTPVTKNEIIKHINTLKNNSAPGLDGVTSKIIKFVHPYILTPLVHIINLIFITGEVPFQFKTSVITPIYKANDKTIISNYRPISLINNFSKIFEKCLKERLINYFMKNSILHGNQFGFLEGKSTADAMYETVRVITENLDSSKKCIAVFLDLAKAFDTVNHEKLINVLNHYGVRGTVLNVFKSYLSNRQQYVKINETISDPRVIKIGVPQGTVLGPILFITYINSMLQLNIKAKIISYADDTIVLFSGHTWEDTKEMVQNGISQVKNWLDMYQLSLNVDKTKYIAFSITNANRPDFHTINITNVGDDIKQTDCIKYLGVVIDQNIKWDNHIDYLTTKVRKLIYKFYQIREILSKKIMILVYKALAESLFRYGILVWGGLYSNALKKLNVIQNYILKIIFSKNNMYPTRLLYSVEISNIRSLYIHSVCVYTFKKNELKSYTANKYGTRSTERKLLEIPPSNKRVNQRFVTYLAPKFYNLLPVDLRKTQKLRNFSLLCRQYIHTHYQHFLNLLEN